MQLDDVDCSGRLMEAIDILRDQRAWQMSCQHGALQLGECKMPGIRTAAGNLAAALVIPTAH
jgi:hypothetical protein